MLLYCIPRCATPSLGRSPRANRWKNDDLGLVPICQKKKYLTKICDFPFFPSIFYTDSILKQLNKLKNINMFFSLFIFLCRFPFCFPVVLPYCIPRCTTPSLGRSPRANRWKNDDLGLVPICQKKNIWQKSVIFHFSLRFIYRQYFKAIKQIENYKYISFTFHFSLSFPVLFPRCASLLYSPLHYPVVGSKSSSQALKKWWLRTFAHLRKKYFTKICDFFFR